jgi:predicted TIM-barrel fold metal-dependent hydrolase
MSFCDGPMIDAHHHLWGLSMGMHPWLVGGDDEEGPIGLGPLKRDYLVEDLVRDAANQKLVKLVHIQAG